jgi:hypothetical protein
LKLCGPGFVESGNEGVTAMALMSKMSAAAAILVAGGFILAQPADAAHRAKFHRVAAAQGQQQIACTVLGCMPVPAACTPVAGKTPGGIPTGFDVIVCPPGAWPLR